MPQYHTNELSKAAAWPWLIILASKLERETYLDIEELLGKDWGTVVNGGTRTIEGSAEHLNWDGHTQDITCELNVSVQIINAWSSLEDLNILLLR